MYKNTQTGLWGSVLLVLIAASAALSQATAAEPQEQRAAGPAAKQAPAKQADEAPSLGQLPAPLNKMTVNLEQLEQTGYFKLVKVELGRTAFYNQEALLWTVQVVKPIHCRHAMLLLRRISEVRFYRTWKDRRTELHMAHLFYPTWIESDAANGRSLDRDEQFQIWVHLNDRVVDRLNIDKADTIEFRASP